MSDTNSPSLARTVLPVAVFAALWIYLSDRMLAALVSDPALLTRLQTYKGLVFVLITTLLLYGLLRRELRRREIVERRLSEKAGRLAVAAVEAETNRAALAASERRFRATFEQAAVGIAHVAPDGRWLHINQKLCDIVGYGREDLLARTFQDITHPDDLDIDLAYVRQMLAGEIQMYTLEKRYFRKDGTIVWINLTVSLVRGADGAPDYFISVIEDISGRKAMEAALRESSRKLSSIVDSLSGFIYRCLNAPDWPIEYVSQGILDVTGYPAEDFISGRQVFGHCIVSADRERVWTTVQEGIEARRPYVIEYCVRTASGQMRWVWEKGAGVFYDDRLVALEGFITDITGRKQAEAALQEFERRFRSTLEHVHLLAVSLDTEGRITFCNDFLLTQTGWRREAVLGRSWFDIFLPEAERASMQEMFEQSLLSGELPLHYENEIVTRAGDRRLVHWNNTVLHDPAGHIVGTVSLGEDITDRHQAQLALQQSEKRLRDLIDGLGPHNFVGLLTPEGIIVEANRSALTAAGLTPADVQGKPVEDTYWWSYSPAVQHQLREAVVRAARGEPSRYDVQIRVGEGQFATLDFSVQPMRDESGRIVFLVPSAVVITERIEAERKLRESSRQLEILSRQLLAAQETERRHIARELHDEIGQLLTVVKLDLQSILRQSGTAALAPAVKDGMESIDRVVARVRDLSLDLRPSMLDDLGLLPTLRWYMQRQTQRLGAGIEIALTLPPSLPRLPSEIETACFRIVQEALTNIVRHAGARRIDVALDATQQGIELTVHDDGTGFNVEAVRRLALNGGGFGLLGMQERAELAGGQLILTSATGQGTIVRARFPATVMQEPMA